MGALFDERTLCYMLAQHKTSDHFTPTMTKRRLSKRQHERIRAIQERRRERVALRNSDSESVEAEFGPLGAESTGRVITHFGAQVDIEGLDPPYENQLFRCHVRANVTSLVTGDRVIWCHGEPLGVIVAQEPRSSELLRPDNYGKLRPVAANIDRIGIVFAPKPTAFSNLLDRYLVAAEVQGITPFLVINKWDIVEQEDHPEILDLIALYGKVGYDILKVSATTGQGIDELRHYLADHTSILVGQSGVGKSSLINQLQPEANTAVGPLSETTDKGTHTTTASTLYHLHGGGTLIDSPGIREFSLTHIAPGKIIHGYRDFRPHLGHCKFRDCRHESEPGCALLKAVSSGEIEAERMNNYRQILLSLEDTSGAARKTTTS